MRQASLWRQAGIDWQGRKQHSSGVDTALRHAQPSLSAIPCHPLPPLCAGMVENGMRVGDWGELRGTTYESNVLYTLRFMIDKGVVSGGG